MPYLEFQQQSRSLGPGVLSVGSGSEAGWRIRDHDLARLHALFLFERDGRAIVSRGSPDAEIAVNGRELGEDSLALAFGDRIQLGRIELRYVESTTQLAETNDGFLHDTRRDRLYRLGEINEIGRVAGSTIQLLEPEVSRDHAEIRWEGMGYVLLPRAGAATLLNGARLAAPAKLNDGDVVSIGRSVLRFSTTLPASNALEDGRRHRAEHPVAPAPTRVRGALENHRRRRRDRKRVGRVAVVALAAAALIAGLVTAYERSLASTRATPEGAASTDAARQQSASPESPAGAPIRR